MSTEIFPLHTHIVGSPVFGFQRLLWRSIWRTMAFRPSVTWPSGQVAFIAMETFFVPSNWTPHWLLSINCISFGSQNLNFGHRPNAFLRAGIFGIKVIVWMLREQVCTRNKVVRGYTWRAKWNELYFASTLKFWYYNNFNCFLYFVCFVVVFVCFLFVFLVFFSRTSRAKNTLKLYIQERRKMCHAIDILRLWRYEFYLTFHQVILIDFKTNNKHAKISARSSAEDKSINPKQCRKLK